MIEAALYLAGPHRGTRARRIRCKLERDLLLDLSFDRDDAGPGRQRIEHGRPAEQDKTPTVPASERDDARRRNAARAARRKHDPGQGANDGAHPRQALSHSAAGV